MAYTVEQLVQLAKELRSLGVVRVKAGDVEMELVLPIQAPGQLAPEEQEEATRKAYEEIDKELHAAS